MAIQIVALTGGKIEAELSQMKRIYLEAFQGPPYNEQEADAESFAAHLQRHRHYQGFHFLAARDDTDGRIVGFAYGFTSRDGLWWHDRLAKAFSKQAYRIWLEDAFEVVELAVVPDMQGMGIGGRLHDELLRWLPQATAVLSTSQSTTNATHLYRKRGWVPLLEDFVFFPESERVLVIMGLDLEEWRAQCSS